MKVQEVILKAMAGSLKWWEAAEIIGVSDRTMRRWRERYEEHGYDGLYGRRKGRPSPKRVPLKNGRTGAATVPGEVRRFQCAALSREAGGRARSETQLYLGKDGAAGRRTDEQAAAAGEARPTAPAAPLPGMLLHIDASKHAWFGDGRYYDLITILDDATSEIYYAQLVEEEGTRTLMPAVREVIEQQGIFCALYSDRASHFFVTPKAGGKVDES